MVKVYIEPKMYENSRFSRFCHEMGWQPPQALGVLVMLWATSRNKDVASAHISLLMPLLPVDHDHKQKLLDALLATGYVKNEYGDIYSITGNDEAVALRESRRAAARMGRASMVAALNRKAQPKIKTAAEASTLAWEAYASAYLSRYRATPARNAAANVAIGKIIAAIGKADTPQVLTWFVECNDTTYVRGSHALALAVKDIQHLHTSWQSDMAHQWGFAASEARRQLKQMELCG